MLPRVACRTAKLAMCRAQVNLSGMSVLDFLALGSSLALPCLVGTGANYGLGVGPVPNVLMSSLFTQKTKSVGSAIALTFKVGVIKDNF